jgi:hypothetical protein
MRGIENRLVRTRHSRCSYRIRYSRTSNAGVRAGGVTQFKAGGGWTGFVGNVDNFTINTRDANTKFDFESDVPEPTTLGLIGISLAAIALLRRSRP